LITPLVASCSAFLAFCFAKIALTEAIIFTFESSFARMNKYEAVGEGEQENVIATGA
jgi:hypothetical protein